YWSCEEESTAGRVSSPIPGVAPFTPSANVGFAAIDGPGGSGRVLRVPAEAHTVRGRVPPHEPTSRYVYQHVFRQDEPEAEGSPRTCMTVFLSTPSVRAWRLRTSAEDFIVEVRDSDGELTTSSSQDAHPDYFGRWLRIVLELNQNGNNLGWRATVLTADVEGRQLQQLSGSISNTQLGRVMQCGLLFGTSGPPDRFVGNMSLTRDGSLADHAPWHGYVGETAAE